MRSRERREEVVERDDVEQVHDADSRAQLDPAGGEGVEPRANIEQVVWRDARRIGVVVLGAWRGMRMRVAPNTEAVQLRIGCVRLANVLPQYKPIAACSSPVNWSASA
jgi:hypothetical protein